MTETLDSCLETHLCLENIPKLEMNLTHIIIYAIWVLQNVFSIKPCLGRQGNRNKNVGHYMGDTVCSHVMSQLIRKHKLNGGHFSQD